MVRYTLHVPITTPRASRTPRQISAVHDHVQDTLSRMAPGFTSVRADGRWRDPHGAIVDEPIMLYMVDVASTGHLHALRKLAEHVKRELAQDAVYLTRQTIDTWLI